MWIFWRRAIGSKRRRQRWRPWHRPRLLYADDAYLHFLRGYHLEQLGRGAEARAAYVQARELDPRPWRATAALNEVVRRVAAEEGVLLADVEVRFRAHSPEAGVGWELMADHLHPAARRSGALSPVHCRCAGRGTSPLEGLAWRGGSVGDSRRIPP